MPITIKCEYCSKKITGILNPAEHYRDFHKEECKRDSNKLSKLDLFSIYYIKPIINPNEYIN